MKGIDISTHNGNIDFDSVKTSGVECIIMKATEGVDFRDNMMETYYPQVVSRGFNLGFYHFMSEKTSPSRQAEDFYNAIKDKQYNILPCLDIETNNIGRSSSQITDRCLEFLTRFKQLSGYDCMIYTGGYFGRDNLDSRIKNYPAWIAHYGVAQPMATGFVNVVGHQYTENGSVSGINGNVDVNNFTNGILIGEAKTVEVNTNIDNGYRQVIADFQKQYNLTYDKNIKVDGFYGPETEEALRNTLIEYGMNNSLVGFVQVRVGTKLDYIFGDDTKRLLEAYQSSHNLKVDGKAGINTFKSMMGL